MKKIKSCCIIDDDPIAIFGIKRSMKQIDFCDSTVIYHNGQDAINGLNVMIKQGVKLPSLILLDLNMPIMDGWEFLDNFKKIPIRIIKKIMVYIISSSIDPRDILKSKENNLVSNYISKPIGLNELHKLLTDISYC